jgi:hypothetical protein
MSYRCDRFGWVPQTDMFIEQLKYCNTITKYASQL